MAMDQAIRDLPKQFAFAPEVVNAGALPSDAYGYLVCGMGGSALTPDLLRAWDPTSDIRVHRGYGLPALPDLGHRLVIASSYSGNTEETLDVYDAARREGIPVAVIATGGALLDRAVRDSIPYVRIPSTGIQPRMALGYSILALAAIMRHDRAMEKLHAITALDAGELEDAARKLADALGDRTPIVYASDRNGAIARYWKIAVNETGKRPAFSNVVPEINHNEMTGFDVGIHAKGLLQRFAVVMLRDAEDDARVAHRMEVLSAILRDRGIAVHDVPLTGVERFEHIFTSIISASWMAYHLALIDGAEPEHVPMVEEFKRRIST